MEGWVSFHRKIEEWEWYTDSNTFRVFFHLVLKANHQDRKWKGQLIKRGQLITGRKELAKQLQLSEQQIRTSINKLKCTKEITIKPTNKFTLVTVENYDLYQLLGNKSTNKPTNEQPTNNQQVTTNNNVNNIKKEYKDINKVIDYYKYVCNKFPQPKKITKARESAINARIEDYKLHEVLGVLEKVSESKFLNESIGTNWLNIDWIFNPNNFVKIVEGKYDSKKSDIDLGYCDDYI